MGTLPTSEFVDELWGIIAEELSHLRDKNKMMHALFCVELERDRMKLWAKQALPLDAHRTTLSVLDPLELRQFPGRLLGWFRNLYEEYGEMSEGRDHPSLCRNFGPAPA